MVTGVREPKKSYFKGLYDGLGSSLGEGSLGFSFFAAASLRFFVVGETSKRVFLPIFWPFLKSEVDLGSEGKSGSEILADLVLLFLVVGPTGGWGVDDFPDDNDDEEAVGCFLAFFFQ